MRIWQVKFAAPVIAMAIASVASHSSSAIAGPIAAAFPGSIAGIVRDDGGLPRVGATVVLLNRYDRVIEEALTNDKGIFGFPSLKPDFYGVRVTLASFVPALKQKIGVQPGMQSLLFVNMASVVSSVELVYALPGQGALVSDDWKWTLKASAATRPVLRFDDEQEPNGRAETSIFSDTLGLIRFSAGDSEGAGSSAVQPDLGTAFALATSLYGHNRLQVVGGFGYTARSGLPEAGIRTSFSRPGMTPEISVTLRQLYLPSRSAALSLSNQQGSPALRTMSVGMRDHLDIFDGLRLEYGVALDSISFIDHLSYVSPYARLTYELGDFGEVQLAYSSGAPPGGLYSQSPEAEMQLRQDLAALSALPRISLRDGDIHMQRTADMEIGYRKRLKSRTLSLSAYRESVSNGTLTASGVDGVLPLGDVLPDFASSSSVFNIGSYHRAGYAASVSQSLGDHVDFGVSYGRAGVLAVNAGAPLGEDAESGGAAELRSRFRSSEHQWASARFSGKMPGSGTELTMSYQWTDPGAIVLEHWYMTQGTVPPPGANILLKQPLPALFGMPGRMEATAELQNLLAQGYVSLPSANGQPVVLTQTPRSIRGGLSFVF
jgi:hypothetical protein